MPTSEEQEDSQSCEDGVHESETKTSDGEGHVSRPDEGATRRWWFVTEVRGRPEEDTRDPGRFPISPDGAGGWKVDRERREERGLSRTAPGSPTTRPYRQGRADV